MSEESRWGRPPYPPEVRGQRAVRMVFDHQHEYSSQWKAIESISAKLSINHEMLRQWVRRAETDAGQRPALTSDERTRIEQLERAVSCARARSRLPWRRCDACPSLRARTGSPPAAVTAWTITQIATTLGVSRSRVSLSVACRRAPDQDTRRPRTRRCRLADPHREERWSVARIAAHSNVATTRVYAAFRDADLDPAPAGRKARTAQRRRLDDRPPRRGLEGEGDRQPS